MQNLIKNLESYPEATIFVKYSRCFIFDLPSSIQPILLLIPSILLYLEHFFLNSGLLKYTSILSMHKSIRSYY